MIQEIMKTITTIGIRLPRQTKKSSRTSKKANNTHEKSCKTSIKTYKYIIHEIFIVSSSSFANLFYRIYCRRKTDQYSRVIKGIKPETKFQNNMKNIITKNVLRTQTDSRLSPNEIVHFEAQLWHNYLNLRIVLERFLRIYSNQILRSANEVQNE